VSLSRFAVGFAIAVILQILSITFCALIWGDAHVLMRVIYQPLFEMAGPLVEKWAGPSEIRYGLGLVTVGILTYSLVVGFAGAVCYRGDKNV
jgi:hypothetical protein